MMIITIVRFPGPSFTSVEEARVAFSQSASTYLEVPGLLWKSYLYADDGSVGGVYWWKDRASAEAKFNPGWQEGVTKKYGASPTVEYLETPVVVDALSGVIRTDAP